MRILWGPTLNQPLDREVQAQLAGLDARSFSAFGADLLWEQGAQALWACLGDWRPDVVVILEPWQRAFDLTALQALDVPMIALCGDSSEPAVLAQVLAVFQGVIPWQNLAYPADQRVTAPWFPRLQPQPVYSGRPPLYAWAVLSPGGRMPPGWEASDPPGVTWVHEHDWLTIHKVFPVSQALWSVDIALQPLHVEALNQGLLLACDPGATQLRAALEPWGLIQAVSVAALHTPLTAPEPAAHAALHARLYQHWSGPTALIDRLAELMRGLRVPTGSRWPADFVHPAPRLDLPGLASLAAVTERLATWQGAADSPWHRALQAWQQSDGAARLCALEACLSAVEPMSAPFFPLVSSPFYAFASPQLYALNLLTLWRLSWELGPVSDACFRAGLTWLQQAPIGAEELFSGPLPGVSVAQQQALWPVLLQAYPLASTVQTAYAQYLASQGDTAALCAYAQAHLPRLAHTYHMRNDQGQWLGWALAEVPPADVQRPHVAWEGGFFSHSSLFRVNYCLVKALKARDNLDITLINLAPPAFPPDWPVLVPALPLRPPDVTVSQYFPHLDQPPVQGKWVQIAPWEYGVAPKHTSTLLHQQVDEVWMPSVYNRQAYENAGVRGAHLHVIANGFDPQHFTREGPP